MARLEVDISTAFKTITDAITSHQKEITREVANGIVGKMSERIFTDGKAADGSQIGTYSNRYLRLREKLNRGTDPKVIVSLTRLLELNFGIVEASNDNYGIGVNNEEIGARMGYVEKMKGKNITGLTAEELETVSEAAGAALDRILNG